MQSSSLGLTRSAKPHMNPIWVNHYLQISNRMLSLPKHNTLVNRKHYLKPNTSDDKHYCTSRLSVDTKEPPKSSSTNYYSIGNHLQYHPGISSCSRSLTSRTYFFPIILLFYFGNTPCLKLIHVHEFVFIAFTVVCRDRAICIMMEFIQPCLSLH